jgi:hypothetical protein
MTGLPIYNSQPRTEAITMKIGKLRLVLIASLLLVAGTAFADVTINSEGVGFVGKGDVQSTFDWNNAMLQENAASVMFRMGSGSQGAGWECSFTHPNDPTKDRIEERSCTRSIDSQVSVEMRRGAKTAGQVTGFILGGFEDGGYGDWVCLEEYEYGECDSNNRWSPVVDEYGNLIITYFDPDNGEGSLPDDILQVSVDGVSWFTLN